MKVLLTNSAAAAQSLNPHFTVETEYGSVLVEGSVITLAHHEAGKAHGFTVCPCLNPNADYAEMHAWETTCVVSHIDWDTLGGVLSLSGEKPYLDEVWALIAHNDENGVHRSHEFGEDPDMMQRDVANAMYAWLSLPEQRVFAPRDGSALDVTEFIGKVKTFLNDLEWEVGEWHSPFQGYYPETPLINAGREWAESQAMFENASYVDEFDSRDGRLERGNNAGTEVILRSAPSFVNHMYSTECNGETYTAAAVVGFNTLTGAITLSFEAGAASPLSACEIMQAEFGPLAGGHRGIAGTPRDAVFTLDQAKELAQKVADMM